MSIGLERRLNVTIAVGKLNRTEKQQVLRECPFCGGSAEIYRDEYMFVSVKCSNCETESSSFLPKNKESAIEAWNRRTPIKWPTEKEIEKAMDEKDEAREEFCDCKFSHDFGFARGVQWLKSFVEKGK